MSTLADTRVYVVEPTDGSAERLLRASNKARAVRLAVTARIASQADLLRLFAKGVQVEGTEAERGPRSKRRRPDKPRARRGTAGPG